MITKSDTVNHQNQISSKLEKAAILKADPTVLQETLNQRVVITEGNKQVSVTMLEAMVKGLLANSIKGKAGATNTAFKLIQQMEESTKGMSISYLQEDGSVRHHEVDLEIVLDGLGVSK